MYQYTAAQWILFFGWYSFIGWVWESCYVSVVNGIKKRRFQWINRGFLNGPFLPIYGFAVIAILLATIPVKDQIGMVYLLGALAATLLELVTGSAMERLFKVKYWDYSNLPLNFHGYICFFISLFWGLCAVLVMEVLHAPVEGILMKCPETITEILAMAFVAYFSYDLAVSFREAMDMREILEKLTESNESLQRLERRLDAVVAFTAVPDLEELKDKTHNVKERLVDRIEAKREKRMALLHTMREKLRTAEPGELLDRDELLEQLEKQFRSILSRTNRQYIRTVRHMKRNPGMISKKYEEALKELKELFEK